MQTTHTVSAWHAIFIDTFIVIHRIIKFYKGMETTTTTTTKKKEKNKRPLIHLRIDCASMWIFHCFNAYAFSSYFVFPFCRSSHTRILRLYYNNDCFRSRLAFIASIKYWFLENEQDEYKSSSSFVCVDFIDEKCSSYDMRCHYIALK